jgi:hypothetical protein
MTIVERWYEKFGRALDLLRGRSQAYKLTFGKPDANRVLVDLARFCRANASTFHPDPRVAAALDGRREVWLRIQNHLRLTPEQLLNIYSRADMPPEQEN